ncbi:CBN-BED-2 protein [Aphelenchoides avenae]|nr:CBN-BED-2 protein [Aphelenchus avenae]
MHTDAAQHDASMHVENDLCSFRIKAEAIDEGPHEQRNGQGETDEHEKSGQNGILSTIADPTNFSGCQPIRSAGRKKTHPVWLFFRDLRDISESAPSMRFYWLTSDGIGHVSCLHCSFTSNDRSPNNLRAHLKRSHEADGQYQLFMAALAQTPTQPYVKRKRCSVAVNGFHADGSEEAPSGLLASILQSTAKFAAQHASNSANEENGLASDCNGSLADTATQEAGSHGASGVSTMDTGAARQKAERLTTEEFSNLVQALQSSTAATTNASSLATSESSKSIADTGTRPRRKASVPACRACILPPWCRNSDFGCRIPVGLFQLYRIALDLELTFSTHGRRGVPEFCFESNRTAERSGARGRMLSFSETLNEVLLTERVNGAPVSTETWRKLDFSQLMWAIRGKCHARFFSN